MNIGYLINALLNEDKHYQMSELSQRLQTSEGSCPVGTEGYETALPNSGGQGGERSLIHIRRIPHS